MFNKSNKQTCKEIFRGNGLLKLPSIYIYIVFETVLFVENNLHFLNLSRNSKSLYSI